EKKGHPKKKTGSNSPRSQLDLDFQVLWQLSTDNSDDAGSSDARRTNNKAYSRTCRTAGNSGTGNTRSSPARTRQRSTLAHGNAGLKQMRIRLPPLQLTEVSSLF